MNHRFAPVPVRENELLKELEVGGLRFTESFHRASATIPRHAHSAATVTILVGGSFEEDYDFRRTISCDAPTVLIRPPGEPHVDRLGTRGARNLVLELDDLRFRDVERYSALFDEVRNLRTAELVALTQRLRRELEIDDDATSLALEGLAMEMLATGARGTRRAPKQPPGWLVRAYERLRDGFLDPDFRLDELAVLADVHPVHFARTFRATYGSSPSELLRRLRTEWAAEQLRGTDRPLVEIAAEAGFADQSHFTRVFRGFYGAPPGAWRRAHRARSCRAHRARS